MNYSLQNHLGHVKNTDSWAPLPLYRIRVSEGQAWASAAYLTGVPGVVKQDVTGFLRTRVQCVVLSRGPGRQAQAADGADGRRGLEATELRHLNTSGLVMQQATVKILLL